MGEKQFSFFTMLALVLMLGYLGYRILLPFLAPLAWAIVFTIVFFPVYRFILKYVRWQSLAAAITVVLVCILILGPFSYFAYLLTVELSNVSAGSLNLKSIADLFNHPAIKPLTDRFVSFFGISQARLEESVLSSLAGLGKSLVEYAPGRLGDVAGAVFHFVIMAFSLFFFLRDGPYLLGKLTGYLPFRKSHNDRLTKQVKDVVISTIYGGIVVALALGLIGSITFALLGLHAPGLWGLAIALSSFIPFVGSAIVWIPATAWLLFSGSVAKGLVLLIVLASAAIVIDNVVRPVIVGGRLRMPLLVIFFGVLGGIELFGLIGLVIGPLVLAVFISIVDIFKDVEEGECE
ncbi:MAG: AI-2E family transporter [Syntrophorhabdales bacterium]|jgi:predicted PurR-regulated permease PerM